MSIFGGGKRAAAKTPVRAMGIDFQGSEYGHCINVVFGQNRGAGTVIWYGDFKSIPVVQKTSGKGGSGGKSVTGYTYKASFELGICEGVASIVNVYDGTSIVNMGAVNGTVFTGAVGQAPWAHLTGAAALGYSGTTLAAFLNLTLGSSASLPNYNFEILGRNQLGGGVLDADPKDIITAICTDTQIGVNFNVLGPLTQFSNYCKAAGLLFSPVYDTQSTAASAIDGVIKYCNTAVWFSEGLLKFRPYGDTVITGNGATYTPIASTGINLGPADFITNGPGPAIRILRKSPADARNLVRIEYKDRANTYHTTGVVASIDQDVVSNGARAETTDTVNMITNGATARLAAQNILQRIYYVRNKYEFQLSWRYCYLECMDDLTLTDPNTGLNLTPVRIIEIGEDEHGLLSVVAEELPDGIGHGGTYATQANAGTNVDQNTDPGAVTAPYLFRGPGFLVNGNAPEVWCAVTGVGALWGGCDVMLSHDNTTFNYVCTYTRSSVYGVLNNTLPLVSDPDTTSAPNVSLNGSAQLLGGTALDCDQFITMAMVDTEIISYQTATLAAGPSYTLGTKIRRGGYGSAIASHSAGAPFVRLDEGLLRIPVDPSQIGQTIYLKFLSFNVFGRGGRTLAGETSYSYVVGTNVEWPDVPVTPGSIAVTPVADGVSINWVNTNPAAVGCTSIEFATAVGGPYTVLAQVGPTGTAYHHAFAANTTYYYQLRSRGSVVGAGWSAYSAPISSTGVYTSGVVVPGSGVQVGDNRNMTPISVVNFGSKVPAVITYTSAAGTPATATISVAAFTVLCGSISINYNAMSVAVTGTNSTTVTYYLYLDDALYAGGTKTLVATTTANNIYSNNARAYLGSCAVTYPATGGGSGGGGGDGYCVCDDMFVTAELLASEVVDGDLLDCIDMHKTGLVVFRRRVDGVEDSVVECVKLVAENGAELDCSIDTPFDLLGGWRTTALHMEREFVLTDKGLSMISSVEQIGLRSVCHIHVGGMSYAAGRDPENRIFSHNPLKP